MFEVILHRNDGKKETYDALTANQAEYIFFRSRMNSGIEFVELNEIFELTD